MNARSNPVRPATVKCPFCGTLNRVDLARVADLPKCGECKRPIRLDRPLAVDSVSFDRVLRDTTVPVLVDFYADWCAPCRIMAPLLDEIAHERTGEVLILKLDTDANPSISQRFGIRGIPTLIAFRGGQETGREVGVVDMERIRRLVA